jgi:PAS domain S-box-containing protein
MRAGSNPREPSRRRNLLNWAISLGLLLLLGLGVELLLLQYNLRQQQADQQRLGAHAGEIRAVLLAELNATLHLATGLASYIPAKRGQIDPQELQPWLEGLFRQGRYIRNIGLAPDNRISFIYPLPGNEAALGLYYPAQPKQWPTVQRIIDSRTPMLDGPLPLVQGGRGLIYRIPVFIDGTRYWGMISTVIDYDRLYAEVAAVALQRGIAIDLQPTGQAATTTPHDSPLVRLPVPLAGANWQLEARDLQPHQPLPAWLRLLGWSLASGCAALIGLALHTQHRQAVLLLALNQSQRQFLQAFDMTPQGLALLDAQGHLLACNQALCQLLQRRADSLLQQPLEQFCAPAQQPLLQAQLLATVPGQNRSWTQSLLDAQGQAIDVQLSAAVLSSARDATPVRILHIQDIRESKRLERLQREFTSTVSHELRTPLTAISGALGLINGGALGEVPAAMQQMLRIAQDNSQRLSALINDLLDMDKLVAGKMSFELLEQPLRPLLEQAVAQNQPYASQYQVHLQLVEPLDQAWVRVDRQRLEQVLSNLLANAAKFSPAGQNVSITVQPRGDYLRVSVQDHGPGISEAFKARIFGKFAQADATDTRRKGGTGLGLAISKQLIEHMDGQIGFDSEPGAGATFWFELPRVTPP